jgi:hypothetical protein
MRVMLAVVLAFTIFELVALAVGRQMVDPPLLHGWTLVW